MLHFALVHPGQKNLLIEMIAPGLTIIFSRLLGFPVDVVTHMKSR